MSDARATAALVAHLSGQGFPAEPVGRDVVDVLFPADARALIAAAELDVWTAANAGVAVEVEG